MREFEFTLILKADPDEDASDALYATFSDGTISTVAGLPQISFHREADSLEEAIRSAISSVKQAGQEVELVSIDAEKILQFA